MSLSEPPLFEEDVAKGPLELVPGIWVRRPIDRPIPGSLVIEQAGTFGSGSHPTTQLAARALALRLQSGPARVLDVGCGSGILSLVAAKLRASEVVALDRRREAAQRALNNANRNKLKISAVAGTAGALRGRFDLVLANLWVDDLLPDIAAIGACVEVGGHLFVTGAPLTSARRLVQELPRARLQPRLGEGWELSKTRLRPLAIESQANWVGALFLRG